MVSESMKLPASKKKPWLLDALLLAFLFGLASFVFFQYRPFERGINGDASMQIYVAQEIARGHPPYVTVFFPKTPLTGLFGAMAILVGRAFGIFDVVAIRALFFLIAVMCVPFIYLLARRLADSPVAGVMVALALIFTPHFGHYACAGPEPKILTVLWGLISLWVLTRGSWFLGGLAGGFSFLSWQPGGVFIFLALAMAPLSTTTERKRSFLRALLGALLPLCLVAFYLTAVGALAPAFRQTLSDHVAWVLSGGRGVAVGPGARILRIGNWMRNSLIQVPWFPWLGLVGWATFTLESIFSLRWWRKDAPLALAKMPLLLSGYFWLLISLWEGEGSPDFIPLDPYIAFAVGWLTWQVTRGAARFLGAFISRKSGPRFQSSIGLTLIVLLFLYGRAGLSVGEMPAELSEQMKSAAQLDEELGAEGKIQAFGHLGLLVLTGRSNLTPMIHLGPKHYNLATHEPGGFQAILETIQRERPEIVIISRHHWRPWVKPLRKFLVENYQNLGSNTFKLRGR